MKKVTLAVLLVGNALAAMAQTEKGSKLIGASFFSMGFTSQDYSSTSSSYVNYEDKNKTKSFNIGVSPSVAWFVENNFAVGVHVNVTYDHSQTKYPSNFYTGSSKNTSSGTNYSIGPHARYYVGSNDKGKLFAELGASIGFYAGKIQNASGTYSTESKSRANGNFIGSLQLGYEHFISKNLGLFGSFGVGYSSSKMIVTSNYGPVDGDEKRITKIKSLMIPVTIGLQIHLEPCKNKE